MTAATTLSAPDETSHEHRRQPRRRVAAMYSLLRAREVGDEVYRWTGHIYDVSLSGMRFEMDFPVEAGTLLDVRCMLPGLNHAMFRAVGRVVRLHSDDDAQGPACMGMQFESFQNDMDRHRLTQYLNCAGLQAA